MHNQFYRRQLDRRLRLLAGPQSPPCQSPLSSGTKARLSCMWPARIGSGWCISVSHAVCALSCQNVSAQVRAGSIQRWSVRRRPSISPAPRVGRSQGAGILCTTHHSVRICGLGQSAACFVGCKKDALRPVPIRTTTTPRVMQNIIKPFINDGLAKSNYQILYRSFPI